MMEKVLRECGRLLIRLRRAPRRWVPAVDMTRMMTTLVTTIDSSLED